MTVCTYPGCGQICKAKGLCRSHYRQQAAGRELRSLPPLPLCTMDGCPRPIEAKGLCRTHYMQLRRSGKVGEIRQQLPKGAYVVCSFEGCGRPHHTRGLCGPHRLQAQRGGPLRPIGESRRYPSSTKPAKAKLTKHRKTASTLPPGWEATKPAKARAGASVNPDNSTDHIGRVRRLEPDELALASRLLARHAAADLAEMLGLVAA